MVGRIRHALSVFVLSLATPAFARADHDRAASVAALIAGTDGVTRERAFKVESVEEEYAVLAALKLTPAQQDLVMDRGRPYDLLIATDAAGAERRVWFDIGSFFGKEF